MIPKRWTFLPWIPSPLIQDSFRTVVLPTSAPAHPPFPGPQQRVGLTELMRAGAMVVLMWSTAFRTPGKRQGGPTASGWKGPEVGGMQKGVWELV